MPPLEYDAFLAEVCLFGAGPFENSGDGLVGISPQRLESWSRGTAYELTPWQFETVLAMSRHYASVFSDEKAAMPWVSGDSKYALSMAMKAAAKARG